MVHQATCSCGSVVIVTKGEPLAVVVCHCIECQRRTGSVLGVGAYFKPDQLSIRGETRSYRRPCDSGETFVSDFCPKCGSSVFWKIEEEVETEARIGVAVGAFAEPRFPAPNRSVWEQSKHEWIDLKGIRDHFLQGRK